MDRTKIIVGAIVASSLSLAAAADITGVVCEEYLDPAWVANGYDTNSYVTYRIYATLDDPGDQLVAVFGADPEAVIIDSSNDSIENFAPDSFLAPVDLTGAGIWENQWDSYVTVGATDAAGNGTSVDPGFGWGVDSDWFNTNHSWFITPADAPQGLAGVAGRVLIAQFTLEAGESISGRVNLAAFLVTGDFQTMYELPFSCSPAACPGDFDEDGMVGVADLLRVIANWGPCPGCNVDLNGDGWVDVQDMLELLSYWGAC